MSERGALTCYLCGRRGSRGFIAAGSDPRDPEQITAAYCENRNACERRQKAKARAERGGKS